MVSAGVGDAAAPGAPAPGVAAGSGSLGRAGRLIAAHWPRHHGAAAPAGAPPLDDVGPLLELYREWYPFSARFLAAAGPHAAEPGFQASIAAPLGLWYDLVRPEVAETRPEGERVASRLVTVARRSEVDRHAAAWSAVEAGTAAPSGVEPIDRFVRLAAEVGASRRILRLAFAEPLAAVFGCASIEGRAAEELLAASRHWSRHALLGANAGRLAECVRPFVRALRGEHVTRYRETAAAPAGSFAPGRRGS